MIPKLESSQFKTLSEFCNDLAKGIMLAAVLGQGILPTFLGITRIIVALFWVFVSLFLLYLALLCSREAKS